MGLCLYILRGGENSPVLQSWNWFKTGLVLFFLLQTQTAEKLFSEGGQERRDKMAEERKRELKTLRQKLMAGTKDNLMDQFDDLLNASANKVKKTKVSNPFG